MSRIENRTRYLMDYGIAAIADSLKVTVGGCSGSDGVDSRRNDEVNRAACRHPVKRRVVPSVVSDYHSDCGLHSKS